MDEGTTTEIGSPGGIVEWSEKMGSRLATLKIKIYVGQPRAHMPEE